MQTNANRWAALTLCAIAITQSGCSKDSAQRCQDLFDSQSYEHALSTCQQSFSQHQNSRSLLNAATAAGELGQFDQALEFANQVRGSADEALIYRNLARVEWRNGDNDASRSLFERSADVYRAINNDAGLAAALHSLYYFAWQASDHRRSLALANESLQAARRANDADAQAVALSDLYIVFRELGSLGPAELALKLAGDKLDKTSTFSRVNYYLYRGALETKRGRHGMAAHEFEQALAATRGGEQRLLLRSLHLNLVKSNMQLGRLDVAREHLAQAWSYAEPDGSARFALNYYNARLDLSAGRPQEARDTFLQTLANGDLPASWVWELHYWAGKAAQRAGLRADAHSSYEQSIAALDKERESLAYADMKAHVQDDRREPYEALFNLLATDGDARGALAVIEQAKARAFVDGFVADSEGAFSVSDGRIPITEVSDRVDAVMAYVDAMRTSPTVGTRSTQALLAATRDDVSISYFFAEQSLWAVHVAKGKPSLRRIALTRDAVSTLLDAYRRDPDDKATLEALGTALLPTDLLPSTGRRLFLAPDGELSRIGLASLRVDNQYLIERHSLAVIPSLNTLVGMREARVAVEKNGNRVVLANPRGDLPFATQEARSVARLLATDAWTGADANLAQLALARNASVVHIATHSGLGHLGPWIALADGNIAANDLLNLNLAPSLAVLASCLSGASDGAGLWGSLGGIFLSMGTGSALVALWSIPDDTTQRFIADFYHAYAAQPNAAGALATAQREAIASDLAPSLWAGFILLGGVDDA